MTEASMTDMDMLYQRAASSMLLAMSNRIRHDRRCVCPQRHELWAAIAFLPPLPTSIDGSLYGTTRRLPSLG